VYQNAEVPKDVQSSKDVPGVEGQGKLKYHSLWNAVETEQ
jgi:hypothetical protein